jgi:hypothetical protein
MLACGHAWRLPAGDFLRHLGLFVTTDHCSCSTQEHMYLGMKAQDYQKPSCVNVCL